LHYKIIRAPKKFKNQPRPLVRPSYVNFCHFFKIYLKVLKLTFLTLSFLKHKLEALSSMVLQIIPKNIFLGSRIFYTRQLL
jgi:hypothetical protein